MSSVDFLNICGIGFLAVFLLLTILAMLIRVLTLLFPVKTEAGEIDAATVASIATGVRAVFPNSRITRIEREK